MNDHQDGILVSLLPSSLCRFGTGTGGGGIQKGGSVGSVECEGICELS
jgi:hypothetical protein